MKKKIFNPENPNGLLIDMTPEEISQREKENQEYSEVIAKNRADREAKENLKASAKAKLVAGEPLTEEEANTIVI